MDPFEKILKFLGKDYWSLSDNELKKLVRKYNLDDFTTTVKAGGLNFSDYDIPSRKKIIEQLEARDKFASAFFTILISVVALVVSFIAILK